MIERVQADRNMVRKGVIVTDGNERSALAVTRSLGRASIPVYVGAETFSSLAGASRHCTQSFVYPSPWRDPAGYVAALLEVLERWNAAAVFPMTDIAMELIGEHRNEFERTTRLPIPSLEQYHRLSDKYQLTAWAQQHGIPTPDTIYVGDGRIDDVIDQIDAWPIVVKPGRSLLKRDGAWRRTQVMIADDADNLRRMFHETWFLKAPAMLQRYVGGHGEGVFGLFDNGEPVELFAHRRLRERPPSGGVSALREAIALPQPMTEYALQIMREARWNGVAMVEFKVDSASHTPYLMEVNGRFWGSLQLAIDAGVDFPLSLYRGSVRSDHKPYAVGVRSQWWLGDLEHFFSRLKRGNDESALPLGTPSRRRTLLDLINPLDRRTRNEIFRTDDLGPGLREIGTYARGKGLALRRKLAMRVSHHGRSLATALSDIPLAFGAHRKAIDKRFPGKVASVLVICKGNICRSPFAEEWLRTEAVRRGITLRVSSAGLDAIADREAYPMAKSVSRGLGFDLTAHRAKPVVAALVDDADVILVMEPNQARDMAARFPAARSKTFLMGHFLPDRGRTVITDPYGGTATDFDACFAILTAAGDGFLKRL